MLYTILKHTHVSLVFISLCFFIVRAQWSFRASPALTRKWVRISPHIIDSTLLFSALGMVFLSGQYPFQQHWLTAKVIALVCYIVFGTLAIKRAPTLKLKIIFTVLALATYGYILAVAMTKQAFPWG